MAKIQIAVILQLSVCRGGTDARRMKEFVFANAQGHCFCETCFHLFEEEIKRKPFLVNLRSFWHLLNRKRKDRLRIQ